MFHLVSSITVMTDSQKTKVRLLKTQGYSAIEIFSYLRENNLDIQWLEVLKQYNIKE